MTLVYQENSQWEVLLPVLEDHTEWFHTLVQHFFYPEDQGNLPLICKPTSFAQWVVHANRQEGVQPEIVEKLSAVHADLFKTVDVLMFSTKESGLKPSYKDFKKFVTVYEEFQSYIRRLEKDLLVEGSGYDSNTGLRSQKMLFVDITRELDRLERQGKSFCVALVKIDNFELIEKNAQQGEVSGYIKLISGLIKLCIRSFDDAYYLEKDEFILCLKQADVSGGISALERLRKELERQNVMLEPDSTGQKRPLSVSCCIAEPLGGDDVNDLITNLRKDLKETGHKSSDSVLEYHELSPLQRYVQGDNRT